MTKELAIKEFPRWAMDEYASAEQTRNIRRDAEDMIHDFKKKHGILLALAFIWGFSMIVGCCVTGMIVRANTAAQVRAEAAAEFDARLEQYKAEQAYQAQAEHFLSGDASREAAVNQAIDAVAQVIAKLSTDAQKATEACCMLARVMNPAYPDSFQEVAAQPQQWMFYTGEDNTFSQHDREIAESIVRPYMESGIVPNGLTAEMVYGEWTQNDFVLRDSYRTTSTMHTWRYQG